MIAWLADAPERVGETAIVPDDGEAVFGRGGPRADDRGVRLVFGSRARADGGPISPPTLSKQQLLVRRVGVDALTLENIGKAALARDRVEVSSIVLRPGEVARVGEDALLMCVRPQIHVAAPRFAPGEPDEIGLVGESVRAWSLRDELRFYAGRDAHVLVLGPSGAGKELCARALHAMSGRARGPFVARSAATLPAGIIDAELFGNAKNYPNPGMRERKGLVGESDRGTLFLDEIGELPEPQQAHLLRVLDAGEYHRLGEDEARRVDARVVAATNRAPEALKEDLLARFKLRLVLPGLDARREDIPLLARYFLRRTAARDPDLARRFFRSGEPRVEPRLVEALCRHRFSAHARELEGLLLASMATSHGDALELTDAVAARIVLEGGASSDAPADAGAGDERARIERALEAASGNVSVAWKILGLSSRDALNRLIKKHGIVVRRV